MLHTDTVVRLAILINNNNIAKVCRSTAAVQEVIPEQSLDSTINKTADSDDKHIPPVFQTVYLPELDKCLRLVIDTTSH